MVKNQKLAENILTPTTKAADHDVPVTPDEVRSLWYYVLLLSKISSYKLPYFWWGIKKETEWYSWKAGRAMSCQADRAK